MAYIFLSFSFFFLNPSTKRFQERERETKQNYLSVNALKSLNKTASWFRLFSNTLFLLIQYSSLSSNLTENGDMYDPDLFEGDMILEPK